MNFNNGNKDIEKLEDKIRWQKVDGLLQRVVGHAGISFIGEVVDASSGDDVKKMCFALKQKVDSPVIVLCGNINGKANVCVLIDDAIQKEIYISFHFFISATACSILFFKSRTPDKFSFVKCLQTFLAKSTLL